MSDSTGTGEDRNLKRGKTREPTLFSYVVDHDLGFAPDPEGNFCTLVHCKFGGRSGRRNIVELAREGDWVIGTGGTRKDSAGHGRIIYLMRVGRKLSFRKYLSDPRFQDRRDCDDLGGENTFALVSKRYFYFGKNAVEVSLLPKHLASGLAKTGPGFRSDYASSKLRELVKWFTTHYEVGRHGDPCGAKDTATKVRMKRCSG